MNVTIIGAENIGKGSGTRLVTGETQSRLMRQAVVKTVRSFLCQA
jgi:hypothetical protein